MTIQHDGHETVGYGEPGVLTDELIVVSRSFSRDGWVMIENRDTGETITFPARIARELGRAVAKFQQGEKA